MGKIPNWALGPWNEWDTEPNVTVRMNDDKTIDEVLFKIAGDGFSHLEQMDDGRYWIGVNWRDQDGVERMQHISLSTARNTRIYPALCSKRTKRFASVHSCEDACHYARYIGRFGPAAHQAPKPGDQP